MPPKRIESPMTRAECALVHEAVHEKLDVLTDTQEARFRSVEINLASMSSRMETHFAEINGTVGSLREKEIRRDEREKTQMQMLDRLQSSTRWYLVFAVAATGVLVSALDKVLK